MCLFCLLCIAEFYVFLTVHPGMILVNNQFDAKFFMKNCASSWLPTMIEMVLKMLIFFTVVASDMAGGPTEFIAKVSFHIFNFPHQLQTWSLRFSFLYF
jgi:hypothetical protein